MSLDDRACTYIIWTVKLDLGVSALVVIYGLVTVIHTERIALVDEFGEVIGDRKDKQWSSCDRLEITTHSNSDHVSNIDC